ncbi:DNA repair protein rad5 [Cytospora mali]|uniref:DNA repair protein rad5 n=1 Tax=Cytospora mali TaxID=578113 RepID=A0A194VHL2_CYTMA|nr:DNA repair protein rad5 [Valsa mali var. pyri (nom. inval.)]
MESHENGEPPAKKRRFFTDPAGDVISSNPPCSAAVVPLTSSSKQRFSQYVDVNSQSHSTHDSIPPTGREPLIEHDLQHVNNRSEVASLTSESGPSNQGSAPLAFDQETFENFVGDKVKPDVIEIIRDNCGGNMESAVNMYFDGTWKNLKKKTKFPSLRTTMSRDSKPQEPKPPDSRTNGSLGIMPEARYIGSFGVEGWATRSGTNLLKYGDIVRIERQRTQPSTKQGVAAKRVDVIVRFTNDKGIEIGRLAKDTANWVSTLMDQKACKFDATCVYAPEKLRSNDTVFIQLQCYLVKSAFYRQAFQLSDNRTTGIFEEKETTEERDLRLRQVALVRLFQEINLNPTKLNAAAARHQRQDLLDAAEMAEKKNKEILKPKKGDNTGSSTPSDDEDGEELEQDQLDTLYRKAQSFDFDTPEAEPADTFSMTLRPYQKQALHWMLSKERNEKEKRREVSMHPLWEEYSWPIKDADDKDLPRVPEQPCFYMNPYSGDLSLEFPVQEQHCLGGILADEMGLGKTIQMLSLVHTHRSEVAEQAKLSANGVGSVNNLPRLPSSATGVVSAPCTTLVVAPMSLLAQWQSEAENASKEGTLKSMVYYGSDKVADLRTLCCEANASTAPDLIITSYGIVLSEFTQLASKGGSMDSHRGLFSLNFFRIILDEAHNIKNRQSKTAKACYALSAEHRWILTGTPIVNKLEDLFSLVRFLRVEPWNNFSFWRTFITVPFESGNFMKALDVVQTVLEPLVMRRTKDMKTPGGEALVALPPKHIEIVDVELSETERQIYDYIFTRAKKTFQDNVQAGTVMKAFTTIFAQLLRLRQSCCHPTLVRHQDVVADEEEAGAAADAAAGLADDMDLSALIERFTADTDDEKDANAFGAHVLTQIRDEAASECPICCEEPMIEQTVTGCWHSACKKCLLDYINHQTDHHEVPKCFNCREVINSRDLFEVVRQDDDPEPRPGETTPRISLQRLGVNGSSAKIVSLIKHLRALRKDDPKMKSVVFSQFTSFMSLIEPALSKANMHFLRLDGSITQKARATLLNDFRDTEGFCVLLISLKAGGVGLNLTSAKRVYMMDPWWSFAVEAQAIDRVHRMGQEDEVRVYRFIVNNSVEERMLRVQDRKKFIASSLGMMSDEEKKMQRIEDIKELLS